VRTILETPSFTTLASLEAIARNVPEVSLEPDSRARDRTVEAEIVGGSIRWHQDGKCMVFPRTSVAALEVAPLQNAGERFIAIVLTFVSGSELLRYRLVTSHESEAAWLRRSSQQIAQLLGMPVADLS
jgi:hypothetical protein